MLYILYLWKRIVGRSTASSQGGEAYAETHILYVGLKNGVVGILQRERRIDEQLEKGFASYGPALPAVAVNKRVGI